MMYKHTQSVRTMYECEKLHEETRHEIWVCMACYGGMHDGQEPVYIFRTTLPSKTGTLFLRKKGQALLVMGLLSFFKTLKLQKLQKLQTFALHYTHVWIKAHMISTSINLIMSHVCPYIGLPICPISSIINYDGQNAWT